MRIYETNSSAETKKFAEKMARKIAMAWSRKKARRALVLALTGDLGSGKTTFIQGFLRGLGIKKRSQSPTFIIFRRFQLKNSSFMNVYHVDAYRIKKHREFAALGLKEILNNPKNIVLIEWAKKVKKILPKNVIWLKFSHGKKENERTIQFPET